MSIAQTVEVDVKPYLDKISEEEEEVNQYARLVDAECKFAPRHN